MSQVTSKNVESAPSAMGRFAFLVVEDHEFQRKALVSMLENLHARGVYSAPDGREGLKLVKSLGSNVDVVISDLDMPEMDGMEFIRHLGEVHSNLSLVVASALERGLLASVETMAAAYGIQFLGTIEKPVTPRKLEEVMKLYRDTPLEPPKPKASTLSFTPEEITEGIQDDQFEPYFQPKIEIATGRVMGAEALARWRHPQLGVVAPHYFIGALENSGRIDMLMRCMLRKAAETCRELQANGHNGTIAVNVSLRSLNDITLADQICDIVKRNRIDPGSMVLEITESAATTDIARALENLTRLRMKGFGLAIDDYGTGYSSLEQLARIPFTELKIDQAFVTHAGHRESAHVILESSLDMARRLKIKAVAEGVETRENWDMLCELRCDVAQGYYLAKPMAADAYKQWVEDWPKMRA